VAAVAVAAGRQPDFAVGKPEPGLFQAAAEVGGAKVEDAVVIGDNLLSDIAGAHNVGARSILMLTGVTTPEMAAGAPDAQRPTAAARDAEELATVLADFSRGR
jgi:glycerol-1-phosphatase